MKPLHHVGIDVGSTTVKLIVFDEHCNVVYHKYQRHFAAVLQTTSQILYELRQLLSDSPFTLMISGSGGLQLSDCLKVPFIQEVVAGVKAIRHFHPEAEVVIELGGEDAKITYLGQGLEQRMNGICAGGTGAFIDQMADLLKVDMGEFNELAAHSRAIYPIASRCGVFAKTDIQALLNEGASKEDIAASVFQAVIHQIISGLACGRPIRGKVAFIGGPFHYFPELRKRFVETLQLKPGEAIAPERSHLYVALGAALASRELSSMCFSQLEHVLPELEKSARGAMDALAPLFALPEDYDRFCQRHAKSRVRQRRLSEADGGLYLGIDAGSTTTKAVLIDESANIVYSFYGSNQGNPLTSAIHILRDIYSQLPKNAFIAGSAVTGYGESLLQNALHFDFGEVETVAHTQAARFFLPEVDFILDMGGQDIKCIHIKDGMIDRIVVNEACSAGCGSFVENFAVSLNMDAPTFAQLAVTAQHPVDLGSRCTVFMNSNVKQAQRQGFTLGDISAGLAYAVVKNALYKVIKVKEPDSLGKHWVVQGGTFYNQAILRSFELLVGREVIRPNISGLMGAFGAALIAREKTRTNCDKTAGISTILKPGELDHFTDQRRPQRCGGCGNCCLLTIHNFPNGTTYISGNKCERGARTSDVNNNLPDLYEYKSRRIFDYTPLELKQARRGVIGIPRVLNMYENYPFWFTFFTELQFRVQLSPASSREIYEMGIEGISSDTICYPAKLAHGHLMSLARQGVRRIFYPCIAYEKPEDPGTLNHFNCPVVISYPEIAYRNMDILRDKMGTQGIQLIFPFLSFADQTKLQDRLYEEFSRFGITREEIAQATMKASAEMERVKQDIREKGREAMAYLQRTGKKGIVLAGRPYHIDPEIHHGIPAIIKNLGMAVLSEDSIADPGSITRPLRVAEQWVYHSRLYAAAEFVTRHPNLELVQLNSFGCGLDGITIEQVEEVLKSRLKIGTVLKIDEISNPGAFRIRLRSLKAAMEERELNRRTPVSTEPRGYTYRRVLFTRAMKTEHTILLNQIFPTHHRLVKEIGVASGYRLEILDQFGSETVDQGLRYVNNDMCYPVVAMTGQVMEALHSGWYDPDNTSVLMLQTGGRCRMTNYIPVLRKALQDSGFAQVPVISLNMAGLERNPGFRITPGFGNRYLMAIVYGDLLSRVLHRTRPYEKSKGSANALYEYWMEKCRESVRSGGHARFTENIHRIVRDFDTLELVSGDKPKVGLVGEIYVKNYPPSNHDLVNILEQEGAEVVLPDVMTWHLYVAYDSTIKYGFYNKCKTSRWFDRAFIHIIQEVYQKEMRRALGTSRRFRSPATIFELVEHTLPVVSLGNQAGEGWSQIGETVELYKNGVKNIVCMQPFACICSHIVGRGMFKTLREKCPGINIVAVDYDPGASEMNQVNRIKLMLSEAMNGFRRSTP